jgi:phosphatidylglycerol:prolipoprotein diacylglycerol transferase
MFPKLFEIPLWAAVATTWPVFIVLTALLAGALWLGSELSARKKPLPGKLLATLPTAAYLAAFLAFVETPFGKMPINSYGFSIMVGFLLACWIGVKRGKPLGFTSDFVLDVGIIGMIFGIVGAKINYLLQYSGEVTEAGKLSIWSDSGLNPLGALLLGPIPFAFWWWRTKKPGLTVRLVTWQNAVLLFLTLLFALAGTRALFLYQNHGDYSWKVFKSWQSGFVLYGGLIAGVAASVLYVKMRGQSLAKMADLAAGPMMLALAFGRLGCFLNGCCYGKEGEGFPCIKFPADSPVKGKSVHPTQLYETAAGVAFFFLLSWLWKKKRKAEGEVFLLMVMLYGVWRFIIEFARDDDRPRWIGSLTYSQVVSLVALVVAGVWLALLRMRPRPSEAPPPGPSPVPPPEGGAAA